MRFLQSGPLGLLWVAAVATAIPTTLLEDIHQTRPQRQLVSNKVKRAQEVIMFGNQQNRNTDGHGGYAFQRAEKRGIGEEDNDLGPGRVTPQPLQEGQDVSKSVDDYEKGYGYGAGLPEYSQRLQNSVLKSQLYGDPGLREMRYYGDMDDRRKRASMSPANGSLRNKRDLELNPEELLTLITLWEAERRNRMRQPSRVSWPRYGAEEEDAEMGEEPEDSNELQDDPRNGGWLDGPVVPQHRYSGDSQWGHQRLMTDDRRKRFMVSKRRQEGDVYSLAQLLNGPREPIAPVYRRLVL